MANDWQRFHWDLDERLDGAHPALPPPFLFRQAEESEREIVLKVVSSALMMERAWTGAKTSFARDLKKRCEDALGLTPPACVVVQHGSRVIGASVLAFAEDAEFHLLTGPCILHEYRSRGLGSALLHKSLERLREEGLRRATATARVNSTAARYIYRKFGGAPEPVASRETPRLAA